MAVTAKRPLVVNLMTRSPEISTELKNSRAFQSTIPYLSNLVNYFVQIIRVEIVGLVLLCRHLDAELLQLRQNELEPVIDMGRMDDQSMDRLHHRVVHVGRDGVGGKPEFFRLLVALLLRRAVQYARGDAYRRRIVRHILLHHGVGTDPRTGADGDRAENLGPRPHHPPWFFGLFVFFFFFFWFCVFFFFWVFLF